MAATIWWKNAAPPTTNSLVPAPSSSSRRGCRRQFGRRPRWGCVALAFPPMSFVVASLAMKAVGLYRYLPIAHPESFVDVELPTPTASGRDVLVEVKAISVNPVDYKTRAPKDLVETTPKILGWDVAGV